MPETLDAPVATTAAEAKLDAANWFEVPTTDLERRTTIACGWISFTQRFSPRVA